MVRIQSSANFYIGHLYVYCQLYWKDENKEKEAGNDPFLKKEMALQKVQDLSIYKAKLNIKIQLRKKLLNLLKNS